MLLALQTGCGSSFVELRTASNGNARLHLRGSVQLATLERRFLKSCSNISFPPKENALEATPPLPYDLVGHLWLPQPSATRLLSSVLSCRWPGLEVTALQRPLRPVATFSQIHQSTPTITGTSTQADATGHYRAEVETRGLKTDTSIEGLQ